MREREACEYFFIPVSVRGFASSRRFASFLTDLLSVVVRFGSEAEAQEC